MPDSSILLKRQWVGFRRAIRERMWIAKGASLPATP